MQLTGKHIGFVSPQEYATEVAARLSTLGATPYPIALEKALPLNADEQIIRAWQVGFSAVENVLHGHPLHVHFFLQAVKQFDLWKEAKSKLHFTLHQRSAQWLEIHGIPAISAPAHARGIDLIELLIRLRRLGPSIYPTGGDDYEELPELMKELDIPVFEMKLYEVQTVQDEALKALREEVAQAGLDGVLIHSKTLARRFPIAFPAFTQPFYTLSEQLASEISAENECVAVGNYRSLADFCE